MSNVITLAETPLTDIPAKMRELATAIEAGEHGAVQCCALILLSDDPDQHAVFGWGPSSASSQIHVAFHAGMMLLAANIIDPLDDEEEQ